MADQGSNEMHPVKTGVSESKMHFSHLNLAKYSITELELSIYFKLALEDVSETIRTLVSSGDTTYAEKYRKSSTPHILIEGVATHPSEANRYLGSIEYRVGELVPEGRVPKEFKNAFRLSEILACEIALERIWIRVDYEFDGDDPKYVILRQAFPELGIELEKRFPTYQRPFDVLTSLTALKAGTGLEGHMINVSLFTPDRLAISIDSYEDEPAIRVIDNAFVTSLLTKANAIIDSLLNPTRLVAEKDPPA